MSDIGDESALERFESQVDAAVRRAGRTRTSIAGSIDGMGRETVGRILRHQQFPRWQDISAILEALGEAAHTYKDLWESAADEEQKNRASRRYRKKRDEDDVPEPLRPHQRWVRVSDYARTADFYSAAEERVRAARAKVVVSYIREEPPTRYADEVAAGYFQAVMEWAREPGHSVNRLIGVPVRHGTPDEDTLVWLRQQAELERSVKTYDVRVLDWTVGSDLTNVCIIDDEAVFVTFSGSDSQSLTSELFECEQIARNYRGFFDRWWNRATPLRHYLSTVDHG